MEDVSGKQINAIKFFVEAKWPLASTVLLDSFYAALTSKLHIFKTVNTKA